MGDSVDLKNSESMSSSSGDVVSSSSETVASKNEENSRKVSGSDEISVSSSDAEVPVTCTAQADISTSNSDACVSSSSDCLLPKKAAAVEPDSTDSVPEINSCKDDVDDGSDLVDLTVAGSSDDIVDDSPDSSDSAVGTSCRDIVDDSLDSLDSVLEASFKDGVGESSVPYDSIMDVCSSAAEHIKRTINEALKSRESVSEKLLEPDDFCISLEANLKEKIADFEKTVQKTNSPTKESSSSSLSSTCISSEQGGDSSNSETAETELDVKKTTETSSEPSNDSPGAASGPFTEVTSSVPVQKLSNELVETKSVPSSEVIAVPEVSTDSEKSKKNQKSSAVKKKGEKSVDQILKSLGSGSPEERLLNLCRKHMDLLEDLRCSETRLKQCERQAVVTHREKEQLQAEHNRIILAKSRLESLCRELQRQNKVVKEECLLRIREEEEKRKDVASKFQMTLNDISNLMQDNSKKNLQLREENAELAKKLKSLVEHYEMWEKHMGKVLQQKDLEVQLAKAKLAKTNLQLKQETEKFLREKKDLLENMSELQKKCTELASNEVQLRTELNIYTSKYEEFQTVLNKSNQVFASFKTDMDTTSKKIKKLEKETNLWKTKWENSNGALLEMIADKQKRDKELLNAQQRVLMLEKLCRALQAERNDLQNQVKEMSNTDSTISNSEENATVQLNENTTT